MKLQITKRLFSLMLSMVLVFTMVPGNAFATTDSVRMPDKVDEVYQIKTADDLYWFAGLVNGTLADVEQNTSANAVLCNDIIVNEDVLDSEGGLNVESDVEAFTTWMPIGLSGSIPYKGSFDGKGHTIFGLYCVDLNMTSGYMGLFGYCDYTSSIKNIVLDDSYFETAATSGGICGRANSGEISGCSNYATVAGTGIVGGICGYVYGADILDCTNYGSVTSSTTVGGIAGEVMSAASVLRGINRGSVSGERVGGITGYVESNYGNQGIQATIGNCTNYAVVNGTGATGGIVGETNYVLVEHCVNKGVVTGLSKVGGIVGTMSTDSENRIYTSTNEGRVSGTNSVGGIVGTTDASDHAYLYDLINKGAVTNIEPKSTEYVGGIVGYPRGSGATSVRRTYNIGKVTGGNNIAGSLMNTSYVAHNYYDSDLLGVFEENTKEGTPATTAQFKSGEITFLLGSQGASFRQNLTGKVDNYPTLDQSHKVVYKVSTYDCDGQMVGDPTYKNNSTSVTLPHKYGISEWFWDDEYKAATVKLVCEKCSADTEALTENINKDEEEGTCKQVAKTTYTAKVTFEGLLYTDTKEVEGDFGLHKWEDEYTVDENATCTKPGSKSYHCSLCDTVDESSITEIKQQDHEYNQKVMSDKTFEKAATCTENEKYYFSCTCGAVGKDTFDKPDSKLKHTYDNTCDAICNECESVRTVVHRWKEASCTEPKICTVCEEVAGEALGHNWSAATCTKAKTCVECDATTGRALGHDWKAATCTKAKTCAECDATTGRALGHDWKAATCTKAKTCKECGDTTGKAMGHTPGKKATCTTEQKCMVCQKVLKAATGHSESSLVVTKATLQKAGNIKKTCTACGEVLKKTTISKIKTVKLGKTEFIYNGKTMSPKLIVKDSEGNTISSKYYTMTKASGRKNVGKYTYKVKFKGNYSGSKTLTFKINPKATTIKKPVAGKKVFTVKWSKVSKQATGYEIMYATNSKFTTGKKTVKVASFKTTSKKFTKLKAKKTYYVKVRTYKTVNGVKYYSKWSAVKSVKTK